MSHKDYHKLFDKPFINSHLARILLPTVLTLVLVATSVFLFLLPALEGDFLEYEKEIVREVINSTCSQLRYFYRLEQEGRLSRAEAQQLGADLIRSTRYGKAGKDYLWMMDTQARILAHPFCPELEGESQWGYQDPDGVFLFRESAQKALDSGEGYVAYQWQWKDDASRIEAKISFVKLFEEWGWVIGSGIYPTEVGGYIASITRRIAGAGLLVLLVIGLLSSYVLWQSRRVEQEKQGMVDTLWRSEQRFRQMADAIQEVFWLADPAQGKILYMSPAFEAVFGIDRESVYQASSVWFEAIHPEDRGKVEGYFDSVATWSSCEFEYRICDREAGVRWIHNRLFRSEQERSGDYQVVGISDDITERRRKEEESRAAYKRIKANEEVLRSLYSQLKAGELELRENQRVLGTLMGNLPGTVYRCENDAPYTMRFLSEGIMALCGFSPDTLLDNTELSFHDLIYEADRALVRKEIESAKKEHRPFTLEYRIRTAEGAIRWVFEKGVHVRDEQGGRGCLEGFITDITGQKEVEEKLARSKIRFRTLFEHGSEALLTLDERGRILDANLAACKAFGYEKEELLGHPFEELLAQESRTYVLNLFDECQKQETARLECDCLRKYGLVFPAELSITLLPLEDERTLLCSCRDITDHRVTQEAVERHLALLTAPQEAEVQASLSDLFDLQRLQRLQDSFARGANVASIICSPEGEAITAPSNYRHFYTSIRQFETTCSAPGLFLQGQECPGVPQFAGPQRKYGVWNACAPIRVGKKILAHWYIGQAPDSEASESVFRDFARANGLLEANFLAAVREVPAMDKAQFSNVLEALVEIADQMSTLALKNVYQARAIEAKRKAEGERVRLVAAIEQTAEAILIAGADSIIHYANPAFETITGHPLEEVIGASVELLFSRPESKGLAREIKGSILAGRVWKGHMVDARKDCSRYEADIVVSPIHNGKGEISDFVLVARDVTHEMTLENQLRQSQKLEAIGTLAGGIAHDFNNILYAVLGYTELSMQGLEKTSELYNNLNEVMKAGHRASDLIGQILTFSRKSEQEKLPLQLQQILKEALKLVRGSLPSTIEIRQHLDLECCPVLADATQIHQVLMNLCTNAFHAMREHGGVLEVSLNEVLINNKIAKKHPDLESGRYACISVRDSGGGMSKEVLERIFEPYFTTKKAGDGTGLGLATVHGIVKGHGGAITVYSQQGQGSTFNVFLPVYTETADCKAPERPDFKALFGTERLLVLDDEQPIVNMLQRSLERFGYQVEGFTSSLAALAAFEEDPQAYDVVITDQTMPKLTGIQFAARLLRIRPELPIILCTGFSEVVGSQKAKSMGIRDFIRKPIVPQDLAMAIRAAMETQPHQAL